MIQHWHYDPRSGRMWFAGRTGMFSLALGYSGHGLGVNNPSMETVVEQGPIPRGWWHIGPEFKHRTKGPVVMRLTPLGHRAHGRSGFLIHGDNNAGNRSASRGCIVLTRPVRENISLSTCRLLWVGQEEPDVLPDLPPAKPLAASAAASESERVTSGA